VHRRLLLTFAALVLIPAPARAGGYIKPVHGPIVRHFQQPATPYSAGHRGIDIEAPERSSVVASAEGVVAFAGQVGGSLFVSIDHPDGIRTTYSFLSSILTARGAHVLQGDLIALSGAGHAGISPPHLHFGARIGETYIDPEPLLVSGVRANQSEVIRLAPLGREAASAAHGSIPGPTAVTTVAVLPAVAMMGLGGRLRRKRR
jgi:murein DD-endopeptidase MepM/ murein hydrolase activator NlpD